MSRYDRIIPIPSPAPSSASSVSLSPSSASSPVSPSSAPVNQNDASKSSRPLLDPGSRDSMARKKRYLKEKVRSCRERTLESEICRTINKYLSKCLSDDKCRRLVAIMIMVLAVVGLYHIFRAII